MASKRLRYSTSQWKITRCNYASDPIKYYADYRGSFHVDQRPNFIKNTSYRFEPFYTNLIAGESYGYEVIRFHNIQLPIICRD